MSQNSLVTKLASKYEVDSKIFLDTVAKTCFPKNASNEQLFAFLSTCNEYSLNPFLKEIYAFPTRDGGIMPMVSIDGWIKITNSHEAYDGCDFIYDEDLKWCECVIYRKDRTHPTRIREYLIEVKRNTDPWRQSPMRMLRHRAFIQCARVAFGFSGIGDENDKEVIEVANFSEKKERNYTDLETALNLKNEESIDDN
jgi:phage recombination protein Bet